MQSPSSSSNIRYNGARSARRSGHFLFGIPAASPGTFFRIGQYDGIRRHLEVHHLRKEEIRCAVVTGAGTGDRITAGALTGVDGITGTADGAADIGDIIPETEWISRIPGRFPALYHSKRMRFLCP